MAHLGAARGDQGLLARTAGHGPGAQVGHEGPWPPDGNSAWNHAIDIDQAEQAFGNRLNQRARQGGRRGGAGLRG